jgi:phosphoserine phosphatase
MQVMTLIGSGAEALARTVEGAVRVDVLAPGHAVDLYFAGTPPQVAGKIDVVVQPAEGRRKKLLLADMESTVIENEMLDELADFLGLKKEVAEITRKAMNDELDFVAALEARVALLRGLDEAVLGKAAERIRIMPGAPELVATMRANGACCALVSGGFRCFTRLVREKLGFDRETANDLVVEAGKLAGTVRLPVVTRETKLATLQGLAAELGLPLSATLAVGDGANDLPMIEAAGLGVAYHAKPAVAARARIRIERNDLTALLYAQGYRADEIVRP